MLIFISKLRILKEDIRDLISYPSRIFPFSENGFNDVFIKLNMWPLAIDSDRIIPVQIGITFATQNDAKVLSDIL